jgi:hypothetical protein
MAVLPPHITFADAPEMLTDARIAEMTLLVNGIEREVRRCHEAATDPEEQQASLIAVRQAVALRKPLEKWIALRACRAQSART